MQVNIIIVDDMCQLDTTGAFEVLARIPGWTVDLVAAWLEPVRTDRGLTIVPTQTRESAKPADILVVPGGPGIDTERANLWKTMHKLEQMVHISKTLDEKLEDKANDLDATDPAKAKAIRETALFYARQRTNSTARDGGRKILYLRRRNLGNRYGIARGCGCRWRGDGAQDSARDRI